MSNYDLYDYAESEKGYVITKNGDPYLSGIATKPDAENIVEMLRKDVERCQNADHAAQS